MLSEVVDGGPVYVETDFTRSFPVEPWNTVSNLATVLTVVYWAWALRGRYREHLLVSCALPLLLTAAIGATLYHGFRSSRVYLFLDFLPNVVLGAVIVFVFWRIVLGSTKRALVVWAGVAVLRVLLSRWFPPGISINLGNALLFTAALIPLLVLLDRTKYRHARTLAASAASFAIAIAARSFDGRSAEWLPMGSHFLWHVFGGLGTFLLIHFLVHGPVLREAARLPLRRTTP